MTFLATARVPLFFECASAGSHRQQIRNASIRLSGIARRIRSAGSLGGIVITCFLRRPIQGEKNKPAWQRKNRERPLRTVRAIVEDEE
jgi:hypothetical protein